ncbi:MAG: Gfo/Idh/MocA family oxidoreductase [Roseibium sp.]
MIKLALAGFGLIGKRHAKAIAENPRCELAALIEPEQSKATGQSCPVFNALEDIDCAIDGVILATPTNLHRAQAVHAMERGWHVLIEKPIAGTVEDAEAIARTSTETGRKVLVGHHRRHHPRVQKLREILKSGVLGDVVTLSMMWGVKKPDVYFEGNWRSGEDGSPIMINAVHDVDLLRFLFGEIEDIKGFGNRGRRSTARTESAACAMRLEGGAMATLTISDMTPAPWGFEMGVNENPNIGATGQDMLFVSGTKGAISFPSLTLWTGSPDWSVAPQPQNIECAAGIPLDNQLNHFLDIIEHGQAPLIDANDGLQTLSATLALEELTNFNK